MNSQDSRALSRGTLSVLCERDGTFRIEGTNMGSLQRIADACELMAKNHKDLVAERDRLARVLNEYRVAVDGRDRQIAALRGQITKLKKRLEAPHAG